MRLYRNRQGLTKGKKGKGKSSKLKKDPNHRTRPELALELAELVAQWFPNDEIIITGDKHYGGQSVLSHLPPRLISSAMSIPREHSTNRLLPRPRKPKEHPVRKENVCPA